MYPWLVQPNEENDNIYGMNIDFEIHGGPMPAYTQFHGDSMLACTQSAPPVNQKYITPPLYKDRGPVGWEKVELCGLQTRDIIQEWNT